MKMTPKTYGHEYDPESPLDNISMTLEERLTEVIQQKTQVEARMAEDLRQYHGRYEDDVEKRLKDSGRSQVYANLTRYKANAGEGQIVDLLFPNDDEKNWGLAPTPSPDLVKDLKDETPAQIGETQYQDEQGNVIKNSDIARRKLELAREAADKMQVEIDDQLTESRYGEVSRNAIHNGTVLGAGIIKGPVVEGRVRRAFKAIRSEDGTTRHEQVKETIFKPSVKSVNPWDFYPDMSAADVRDCEFTFERTYLSKLQVKRLITRKGFSEDKIKKLLNMTGRETQHASTYVDDVRRMAGLADHLNDDRYELWEYNGPIPLEVLGELGVKDLSEEEDPLEEINGTVFYCGGITLGARIHLIDQEQVHPYHVWCWEKDEACIFGYGVPRLTRHSQSVLNTSWRMMLDNGAITAGPQVGVKRRGVKPMDGEWTLTPFKLWDVDHTVGDIRQAFSKVEFDSHQGEISGIYNLARQLLDEEAGVPMLQQGEQGQTSSTFGGMSMLMNAANVVRRRQIKAFDDDITTPLIDSFYHFNMLYNSKEEVKGDYQVDAKGSTALLAKETQANALINFFNVGLNNPSFRHVFELKGNKLAKAFLQTQQLPKDVIPSDEEYDQFKQQEAEAAKDQQSQQDPQLAVEQMRTEQLKLRAQNEFKLAQYKAQIEREEQAADRQMKIAQIQADQERSIRQEKIELMKLSQSGKLSEQKLIVELKKLEKKLAVESAKFDTEVTLKQKGFSEMRS